MHIVCPHCLAINRVPGDRLEDAPKCGKCGGPVLADRPVELDHTAFDRVVGRSELPVVVDFWAEWCGPCKMMAPAFARTAQEFGRRAVFGKVDTEAEGGLAQRFGIRSIPTLILFRGGAEVARVSGALDAGSLGRWLAQNGV
ncbi:MAG: thioredoxin TrxC [Betaproteobacteria bacterium]|nr:thioredoxin TrxC [Betaproteobacteria bacterium]